MKCAQKVPYESQMLAENAAWLHETAYPVCHGVDAYPCRDGNHWHIGHPDQASAADCHAANPPRLRRPARASQSRRYDSAKVGSR